MYRRRGKIEYYVCREDEVGARPGRANGKHLPRCGFREGYRRQTMGRATCISVRLYEGAIQPRCGFI